SAGDCSIPIIQKCNQHTRYLSIRHVLCYLSVRCVVFVAVAGRWPAGTQPRRGLPHSARFLQWPAEEERTREIRALYFRFRFACAQRSIARSPTGALSLFAFTFRLDQRDKAKQ